tara:strand:- start:29621 stop:30025 length:405 start_codon:yes stop_codon:yes gene_type:complete
MKSIQFKEATNKIAENQEQFNTVISQWNPEEQSVNMCFKLDEAEFAEISRTRKVWYKQVIGTGRMNPMRISPFKKQMIETRKDISDLNDIDLTTPEGKMFFACLSYITTTEKHAGSTPMDLINMITKLKNKINF